MRTGILAATISLQAIASVGASAAPPGTGGVPATGFEVGRPFPLIAFASADDGRPVTLADYRGEKVLLHVFASW